MLQSKSKARSLLRRSHTTIEQLEQIKQLAFTEQLILTTIRLLTLASEQPAFLLPSIQLVLEVSLKEYIQYIGLNILGGYIQFGTRQHNSQLHVFLWEHTQFFIRPRIQSKIFRKECTQF